MPEPKDRFVPLCTPYLAGNERKYVDDCLATGWVSYLGSYVTRFERDMEAQVGTGHAVATASGTAALHLALLVAGVRPDDEVLVSTLTFIAPANAIRYVGAHPVLVGSDATTWQMDPQLVVNFVRNNCRVEHGQLRNKRTGRRVAAIIPVHILGHPVDLDPILEIAQIYGLPVIEDATESLGGRYRGRPVGSLGDFSCFSFNGNKLLTTGGGGTLLAKDRALAERARYLSTQAKDDPLEYVHHEVGYNYRLTNVQAAIGCAQLEQIESFLAAKHAIAARYDSALGSVKGIQPVPRAAWAQSANWLYTCRVDGDHGFDRTVVLKHLIARGIQARPLWRAVHQQIPFADCETVECEGAESIQRDCISLPSSVDLKPDDQNYVIETLLEAIAK